jgi:hypothetical protein
MQRVQAREIRIAAIHHMERASLQGQHVEYVHIVQLAVADVDERGDRAGAGLAACAG